MTGQVRTIQAVVSFRYDVRFASARPVKRRGCVPHLACGYNDMLPGIHCRVSGALKPMCSPVCIRSTQAGSVGRIALCL